MRLLAITLLAAYLLAMLGLTLLQRRILFPRHATQPRPGAGEGIPGLETIWVESPEGKVEGWFLPAEGSPEVGRAPLVFFAHGNAELIETWPDELAEYRRMGFHLFLAEYRGYGRSAGSPSQEAITGDFVAFHDLLIARDDVRADRIVFHGRSLGGGAVCALAEERKPAALILQSTFTSVTAMARRFLMPGFLVRDPFDNLSTVAKLDIPILILHGDRDDLIPYSHAKKLEAAAPRARLITYRCEHNDCPPDREIFWRDIRQFLDGV